MALAGQTAENKVLGRARGVNQEIRRASAEYELLCLLPDGVINEADWSEGGFALFKPLFSKHIMLLLQSAVFMLLQYAQHKPTAPGFNRPLCFICLPPSMTGEGRYTIEQLIRHDPDGPDICVSVLNRGSIAS